MPGGRADGGTAEVPVSVEAKWIALRPLLGLGAVFRVRDSLVRPPGGSPKTHPYVIVSGVPPVNDKPRIALARPVQVCCRNSFKVELHGSLPRTDEEAFALRERGLLFSKRDSVPGFDRDGVFSERKYTVEVSGLDPKGFVGWLPRDEIDSLLVRLNCDTTRVPYPPDSR